MSLILSKNVSGTRPVHFPGYFGLDGATATILFLPSLARHLFSRILSMNWQKYFKLTHFGVYFEFFVWPGETGWCGTLLKHIRSCHIETNIRFISYRRLILWRMKTHRLVAALYWVHCPSAVSWGQISDVVAADFAWTTELGAASSLRFQC